MPKILIVEDDFNTRLGLSEILMEEGFEVEVAEDGAGALEKIDHSTNLLLTDLRLPDILGIELHKKLKQSYPGLTTIIMTAYSIPELYQDAHDAGVLSWLTKPLNIDLLLSTLHATLPHAELNRREEKKPVDYIQDFKKI